jgi:hypothetical protein
MNQELHQHEPDALPQASQSDAASVEARIYSLPNFDLDGRTDGGAEKRFVTALPEQANHERLIKQIAGAGHYRVEVRRSGRFVSSHAFHIEPEPSPQPQMQATVPRVEEASGGSATDVAVIVRGAVEAALQAQAQANQQTTASQAASLNQFKETLTLMREMQGLTKELMPETPKQVSAPNAANSEPLTTEQAVLKIIASDDDALERVASRLLDRNDAPESFVSRALGSVLMKAADNLPLILSSLATISAQRSAATKQAQQRTAPPSPVEPEQHAAPMVEPEQAAPVETPFYVVTPAPVKDEDDEPLTVENCLEDLVGDLNLNAPVAGAVNDILALHAEGGETAQYVDLMMSNPASVVLQILTTQMPNAAELLNVPHAEAWLEKLRAEVLKRRQQNYGDEGHTIKR